MTRLETLFGGPPPHAEYLKLTPYVEDLLRRAVDCLEEHVETCGGGMGAIGSDTLLDLKDLYQLVKERFYQ